MSKINRKVTEKISTTLSKIIPAGYGYICIVLNDSSRDVITNLTPSSLHDILCKTLSTAPAPPSLN